MSTSNTAKIPGRTRVGKVSAPGRNRVNAQAASDLAVMDLPPLEAGLRAMQGGQPGLPAKPEVPITEDGFFPQDMDDFVPTVAQKKRPFWGAVEVTCVAVSFATGIPLGIWIGHWIHALPA